MGRDELIAQRSNKQQELCNVQAQLNDALQKLELLRQAFLEIEDLENDADTLKSKFYLLDYIQKDQWYGKTVASFESESFEPGCDYAKQYGTDISALASQLVAAQVQFDGIKNQCTASIGNIESVIAYLNWQIDLASEY